MTRTPPSLTTLRHHLPSRLSYRTIHPIRFASTFQQHPSPPRLPAEQQAEFERLQRAATERQIAEPSPPLATSRHTTSPTSSGAADNTDTAAAATGNTNTEPTTGGVWRGAPPEFEGDTNPRTGEVGGPKNEPLRWGSVGDWSYNGRVTDF